LYLHPL